MILWDIDGTLVRGKGGRVSMSAFIRALQRVSQLETELAYPNDVAGKTDSGIALEVLAAAAAHPEQAEGMLEHFTAEYARELDDVHHELLEDMLVLPGVPRLLQRLRELGVTQTLLTGNLRPIAEIKLRLVELDQYVDFDLGAFGSDHRDRNHLVPLVRERAARKLGKAPRLEEMVVVGDTHRDIACARAGGVRVVAVATGSSRREELAAHAPDALLEDLSDTDAVVETLLRYSTYSGSEDRALIV